MFRVKVKVDFLGCCDGFPLWGGPGRPGGLKLDEIEASNSFLRLPMARNGLKYGRQETSSDQSEINQNHGFSNDFHFP